MFPLVLCGADFQGSRVNQSPISWNKRPAAWRAAWGSCSGCTWTRGGGRRGTPCSTGCSGGTDRQTDRPAGGEGTQTASPAGGGHRQTDSPAGGEGTQHGSRFTGTSLSNEETICLEHMEHFLPGIGFSLCKWGCLSSFPIWVHCNRDKIGYTNLKGVGCKLLYSWDLNKCRQ